MNSTASDAPGTEKAALRQRFRAYRNALSPTDGTAFSRAICEQVLTLPEIGHAATVHLYWPLVDRGEVDTRPLLEALASQGKTLVLPVIDRASPAGQPVLQHRRYTGQARLQANAWGVREPTDGETVPVASLDAIIVPAFGAGRNGHRIGHGFGYYDVFLREASAPTICVVYEACLVDAVPAEAHDIPVSLIVTERTIIRPGGLV